MFCSPSPNKTNDPSHTDKRNTFFLCYATMSKFDKVENKDTMDELFGDDSEEEDVVESECNADKNKARIAERDPSCGVLAFHDGTEEALFVFLQTKVSSKPAPISELLTLTDQFCYQRHWMMHIGDQKRQTIESIFTNAIQHFREKRDEKQGFVAVELGSYCGYSALVFAQHLHPEHGDHLYCIEAHPKCAAYTRRMVELGGVQDRVTVITAEASDVSQWSSQLPHPRIDFLFIDHDKNSYLKDLQDIDHASLLSSGACVVADNVLCLNKPLTEYLDYVRNPQGSFQSSQLFEGFLEYTTEAERQGIDGSALVDGIEMSIHK